MFSSPSQATLTFQDTQLLYVPRYAWVYVPSSYTIISKGTLSSPSQAMLTFKDTQLRLCSKMLRFSPRYAYVPKDVNVPSYTATQLRLQICLCSFKLRYNIKRYAFNPMSSYAYVPRYAATNYVPRYAYAPKDTVTF